MGVALLGNFDIQVPTAETIHALIKLLTALAQKYNIDPTARVPYHKEIKTPPYITTEENYAIAGHRDG